MNNIGHIENNFQSYLKNKTEIKPIKKINTDMTFSDLIKKEKKICSCFQVTEKDLKEYNSFEEAKSKTKASTRCTSCLYDIKKFYEK